MHIRLELEADGCAGVERTLEAGRTAVIQVQRRSRSDDHVPRRWLLRELNLAGDVLGVGDVEHVHSHLQYLAFLDRKSVFGLQVELKCGSSTAGSAASADRNFALIQVARVIAQQAERNSGLSAEAQPGGEALGGMDI